MLVRVRCWLWRWFCFRQFWFWSFAACAVVSFRLVVGARLVLALVLRLGFSRSVRAAVSFRFPFVRRFLLGDPCAKLGSFRRGLAEFKYISEYTARAKRPALLRPKLNSYTMGMGRFRMFCFFPPFNFLSYLAPLSFSAFRCLGFLSFPLLSPTPFASRGNPPNRTITTPF